MAEIAEIFKWVHELSQYVPLAVLIMAAFIMRDLRRFMTATRSGIIRNCVHHSLMFEKMDIERSTVAKAESDAGLSPGKESDLV